MGLIRVRRQIVVYIALTGASQLVPAAPPKRRLNGEDGCRARDQGVEACPKAKDRQSHVITSSMPNAKKYYGVLHPPYHL